MFRIILLSIQKKNKSVSFLSLTNLLYEEDVMKKNRMDKSLAKSFAAALNNVLKVEANSTSCLIVYQPKVPKELSKFRTNK